MGLFYVDTSAEDTINAKKEREDEIKRLVEESFEDIKDVPNQIFPEFLWNIQVNEFENDNYRLRGSCDNLDILNAYKIRRKYPDYWDYLDAMELYHDYVEFIDNAYGSFDMMKKAHDEGLDIVFIPPKPKMTNKKKNKALLESGFLPSRIDKEFEIDVDSFQQAIDEIPRRELLIDDNYELSKKDRKLTDRIIENKSKKDRVDNIFSYGGSSNQGLDAIIAAMNSPTAMSFDDIRRTESFTDEMEHLHDFDNIPQDILEDMMKPKEAVVVNGHLLDSGKKAQTEILKELAIQGYDFFGSGSLKNLDVEVIRAAKEGSGYNKSTENLTPKQLKKLKKKMAKKRKKEQMRLIGDRRLQDTLLRNRVHFSQDMNGFADFRLSDVIPDVD